jgi:hypothetical protein
MPPLPVAVTAHTFRRTYVTLMLEAGAPLTYVQDQVGHEDTKTTQEIYARVLRRQQRAKVGAAFNELMYGARELAFRSDDETRSSGGDLLMRSPFDEAADRVEHDPCLTLAGSATPIPGRGTSRRCPGELDRCAAPPSRGARGPGGPPVRGS